MSSLLRRIPISRLLLLCMALVFVGVAGTALASALGGGPKPAPKPLAEAVHDALSAPKVDGLSARVQLVDRLVEGASLQGATGAGGSNPLLSGASGRVWIASDGKARLELQSEKGATQILYDGSTLTLYEAPSNMMYQYTPPAQAGSDESHVNGSPQPPSVTQIQEVITHIMGHADLSGAVPTDVAGQPAYAVRISPRSNGGLIGGAELAWDANHGIPLKLAVYAKGDPAPVLELVATEVSYGPVPDSTFSLELPSGVKTTKIGPIHSSPSTSGSGDRPQVEASVTGVSAVQAKLPFTLQAPSTLAGMNRNQVRLIEVDGHDAGMLCYGEGLGGIVVIESASKSGQGSEGEEGSSGLSLPHVSIDGAKASELPTALGTVLRFSSGGVEHILAGSVTPAVLQSAARGL
jgi:outer membrane lipoprotein-sorting protein